MGTSIPALEALGGARTDSALPPRDLFQVARYLTPTEAHIARGCLASAGIPAVVADDHLVQANSLWTAALGGVRVLVPQQHMQDALALLAAVERGELALGDDADVG